LATKAIHLSSEALTRLEAIKESLDQRVLSKEEIVQRLFEGLTTVFGFSNATCFLLAQGLSEDQANISEGPSWHLPDQEKKWLIRRTQDLIIKPGGADADHIYIPSRRAALNIDKSQLALDQGVFDFPCDDELFWVLISDEELILAVIHLSNWSQKSEVPYSRYSPQFLAVLRQFMGRITAALDNLVFHKKIESLLTEKKELKDRIRSDEEKLEHRLLELSTLYDTSSSLGQSMTYYEIVNLILDSLSKVLHVDIGGILLLDFSKTGEIFIRCFETVSHDMINSVQNNMLTAITPFLGYPLDRNTITFNTDFLAATPHISEDNRHIRSFANVPLYFKESIIGMLNVCSTAPNAFSKNEITFLHTMANHLSSNLGRIKVVKELEKSKLATMVKSMAEGIIMLDENNQVEVVNPAAIKLLDLPSADDAHLSELLIQRLKDFGLLSLYYDAMLTGQSIQNHQIQSSDKFLSASVTPVLDSDEKTAGMVMALRDVTELQKINRVKTQRLEIISKVNLIINSIQDLDNLLSVLMEFVLTVANAEMGSIQLKDGRKFITKVHSNFPDKIRQEYKFSHGETISEHVATRRDILFIEKYEKNNAFYQKTKIMIRSYLCIPITVKGELIGVVNIVQKVGNPSPALTPDDIETLTTITSLSGTAIYNAVLFQDIIKKQKLDQELKVAHDIQKRLLPTHPPVLPNFNFGAVSIPAREIGGDYYDFFPLENGEIGIVVADIVGKGIPAALFMIMVKIIMQTHIISFDSPSKAMVKLNEIIYKDSVINKFVPLFYGILNPERQEFRYCNAGEEPGLLFSNGRFTKLDTGSCPLGAWLDSEYIEKKIVLKNQDIICIYTDGIVEARNSKGQAFGEERFKTLLRRVTGRNSSQITEGVVEGLQNFVGHHEQHDDLTMVVIKAAAPADTSAPVETPVTTYDLAVLSSKKHVGKVREEVDKICQKTGFSEKDTFNIKLAVNEAQANVIEHAYGGKETGEIKFKFLVYKNRLQIIIKDNGRGMDQKTIKNENHLEELEGSGLGVYLIKSLMDEVEYKRTSKVGTELWLTKYFDSSEKTTK